MEINLYTAGGSCFNLAFLIFGIRGYRERLCWSQEHRRIWPKFTLFALAFAFALTPAASAQCPDVVSFVSDLLSEDQALARSLKQEPCLLVLFAQDRAFFDREVLPRVQSENPLVRAHASGVLAMMTFLRHDSGEVLASFLPVLVKHIDYELKLRVPNDEYQNHKRRQVLENILIVIAKILKQTASPPPDDVLDALISMVKGGVETPRAFYALAQVHPMPERVSKVLVAEVEQTADSPRKGGLLRSFGQTRDLRPEILSTLITSLRSDDKEVVHASMAAIGEIGPKAAAASSELRRLAEQSGDKSIAATARYLAERLESPNKNVWPPNKR